MPPKKDAPAPVTCIEGYDSKETKLLAAAFVSSIGPDKYDFPLFAKLTGFTEGTLKKFWPPVKKKVIEEHPNFGTFISGGSAAAAPTSKATGGKKRKAADADADAELEPKSGSADTTESKTSERKKKAPAKGKARGKKVKTEEVEEEEKLKEEEDSADGGDGMDEV